jgi:hypothetical protein
VKDNKHYIDEKLNTLVKLMLTSGVQPSELADNVFLKDYTSIKFFKQNNKTVGELTFFEVYDNSSVEVILRYFYDSLQRVILIEEEYLGEKSIIWDRDTKELEIINEVVHLLKMHDKNNINSFLSTLPKELCEKIEGQLKKVV